MFHKEGKKIIFITVMLVLVLQSLNLFWIENPLAKYAVYAFSAFILIAVLQFFRNPDRTINVSHKNAVSPVDGKVVAIEEVFEPEFFKEKRIQISIFMSPINVHVTRYPVSGQIVFSKYHPGKYLVAWHPKSSEENERTTVVLKSPTLGNVLYRQIAGAMARRIVNYAEVGTGVIQGDDSGFIKFGSRVDVFLPLDCIILVRLNQKVKGGVSIIASRP